MVKIIFDNSTSVNPYFSIIIPMFNAEKYIRWCINSILASTFTNFEVIVIDDCSKDNSLNIVTEHYINNKFMRVFALEKNTGQSNARNIGISLAKGDYIIFIDNDDAITSEGLKDIYSAIEAQHGVDVLHVKCWYESRNELSLLSIRDSTLKHEKSESFGLLSTDIIKRLKTNWINNRLACFTWLTIVNRKFVIDNNIKFPVKARVIDDKPFVFACLCKAKKFFMLNKPFYIWRVHNDSMSHGYVSININIDAMISSALYVSSVLDDVFGPNKEELLKTQCVAEILKGRFNAKNFRIFFKNGISPELDTVVNKILEPIFKENTPIVKYWFYQANLLQEKLNNKKV